MPSLTLPPRGVFVPTALVYTTDLSPAAFHTWVQLRGLALRDGQTPPFTIQDLSRLTGKSPSALYGHLAVLKSRGALRWRSTGKGILTIVFDSPGDTVDSLDGPAAAAAPSSYGDHNGERGLTDLDSRFQDSGFLESGIISSPSLNSLNLNSEGLEREEGKLRDSGIQEIGKRAASAGSDPILSEAVAGNVIAIYRDLTGRRPNQSQRLELHQQVTDLDLWRRTLAHWQVHGWNPGNLAGLLDLYQRGGPEACHFCGTSKPEPPRPSPARRRKPIDDLIDELDADPKESRHGRPPRVAENP